MSARCRFMRIHERTERCISTARYQLCCALGRYFLSLLEATPQVVTDLIKNNNSRSVEFKKMCVHIITHLASHRWELTWIAVFKICAVELALSEFMEASNIEMDHCFQLRIARLYSLRFMFTMPTMR